MEDKSVQVNKEREISIDEENSCLEKEITSELNEEEYDKLYKESFLYNKIVNSDIIKNIKTYLYKIPGLYYIAVHMLFMVLIGLIIFFVTNKVHLCMTLFVISLDAIANVVFYDCPLSSLEKKYLSTSMIETRLNSIQKWGMMYANDRCYDTQLEVIINGWTLCAAKILTLIVFDWFNINY